MTFEELAARLTLNEENELIIKNAITTGIKSALGTPTTQLVPLPTQVQAAGPMFSDNTKRGLVVVGTLTAIVGGIIYFIKRKKGG